MARRKRRRVAGEGGARPPDLDEGLTRLQQRFLDELCEQVDSGQVVTQRETAKRLHMREETISHWMRDPTWRRRTSAIIRAGNEPLILLAQRAVARAGMKGSLRHAELAMLSAGMLDTPSEGSETGAPVAASSSATVVFVGLPQPPSREEAMRRLPPSGSAVVIPAPELPPTPRANRGTAAHVRAGGPAAPFRPG